MKIQVVNAYLRLMGEGVVPRIGCNDRDHTPPVAALSESDEIVLYCLGCSWATGLGTRGYTSMKEILILNEPEWIDYED